MLRIWPGLFYDDLRINRAVPLHLDVSTSPWRRTYLGLLQEVVVHLGDRSAHLVMVLALRTVTFLQLVMHQTELHHLDPLLADSLFLPLLVGCGG